MTGTKLTSSFADILTEQQYRKGLSLFSEAHTHPNVTELEMRFSTAPPAVEGKFNSNVHSSVFYRVLNHVERYGWMKVEIETVEEAGFAAPHNYIRLVYPGWELYDRMNLTEKASKVEIIRKEKQSTLDVPQVNVRLALSNETRLPPAFLGAAGKLVPSVIRRKRRQRFIYGPFLFDFTVVLSPRGGGGSQTSTFVSHEIELEYFPGRKTCSSNNGENCERQFQAYLSSGYWLLQLLQDSPFVTQVSVTKFVTDSVANHTQQFFPAALPETLQQRHVSAVRAGGYAVTAKLDGEHALLVFIEGRGYLYDRRGMLSCAGLAVPHKGFSMLDGELVVVVNGENKPVKTFFAFDALFYNDEDFRERMDVGLRKRLDSVKLIMDEMITLDGAAVQVRRKEFHFEWQDKLALLSGLVDQAYGEEKLPVDGLIFVPDAMPYPKRSRWPQMFKWKSQQEQSIDFSVRHQPDGSWILLVQDNNGLVEFEPFPRIQSGSAEYPDEAIIECAWDAGKGTFVPRRVRLDKLKPNYRTVAMDVWESIKNPVALDSLLRSGGSSGATGFGAMRALHNVVKRKYLKSAVEATLNPTVHLLDLACGKAGDLNKWIAEQRIVRVVGVDVSESSLQTARTRVAQAKTQTHKGLQIGFSLVDLARQNLQEIIKNDLFDVATCHFALHFFFETQHTLDTFFGNCVRSLKPGGLLVCTFFDGRLVDDLLEGTDTVTKEGGGKGFVIRRGEAAGSIRVQVSGDTGNVMADETLEYLVYLDKLVSEATRHGLLLEHTELFSNKDIQAMTTETLGPVEKTYSDLNRVCVFRFSPQKPTKEWMATAEVLLDDAPMVYRRSSPRFVSELLRDTVELNKYLELSENTTWSSQVARDVAAYYHTDVVWIAGSEKEVFRHGEERGRGAIVIRAPDHLLGKAGGDPLTAPQVFWNIGLTDFQTMLAALPPKSWADEVEEEEAQEAKGSTVMGHDNIIAASEPVLQGKGENDWTIDTLRALAKVHDVSIPKKAKKKHDLFLHMIEKLSNVHL